MRLAWRLFLHHIFVNWGQTWMVCSMSMTSFTVHTVSQEKIITHADHVYLTNMIFIRNSVRNYVRQKRTLSDICAIGFERLLKTIGCSCFAQNKELKLCKKWYLRYSHSILFTSSLCMRFYSKTTKHENYKSVMISITLYPLKIGVNKC